MKTAALLVVLLVIVLPPVSQASSYIIYTANQSWLSRIYVLDTEGSVERYFEYDFYRFCGMEVVDGELYVAEAFAPRLYKVDIETGDLEVVVDDWSLYYFYGVAFDGTYFYLDEWDLNRYEIDGTKDGTASFDEDVYGCAWDGQYLWTLDGSNVIKCWDISAWPSVVEVVANAFAPPSPSCRGLWFDGRNFWTAESLDGVLGQIYVFDHDGVVVGQFAEPAFSGWGACLITVSTGADEHEAPSFTLYRPVPNPFSGSTTIRYSLPSESTDVRIEVYDVAGRLVRTLVDGHVCSGEAAVRWDGTATDGSRAASGIYFCRMAAAGVQTTARLVLLR
jgi:hypothetical protein